MSKVTDIKAGKKPPGPCPHCGAIPAHPYFTCPRIEKAYEDEDGTEVTYFRDFVFPENAPPGDDAA